MSDDIIIGIVKDRLAESDCKSNGWRLDGFRLALSLVVGEAAGKIPDKVLYLEVPDDMLIERVVGRRPGDGQARPRQILPARVGRLRRG